MLGKTLNNRYEIQQTLSKKQGKQTFLGLDQVTQKWVIVKVFLFNQGLEWEDLKLFEREAETLKELDHPSIPRYLDYFEINLSDLKGFALIQTNIQAISLEENLKNGRIFSEEEVINIAKQLLEILIYLHEKIPPIIHRDLKSSNILLTDRSGNYVGKIYLIDFGSVQNEALKIGNTNTIVGTYGYMPLEQFGGRTVPASDLYSLGATLARLITGKEPAELPQKNGKIDIEEVTNISISFKQWLNKMLEPQLELRFESAKLALNSLENLNEISEIKRIEKPKYTQIKLTKNTQEISIFIPPFGFDPSLIFIGGFAIAWNSFITFWTLGALFTAPFPMNIPFVLFSIPFWTVGIFLAYTVLFSLYGKTYLEINDTKINLTFELFNFRFQNPKPSPRKDIYKIEYIPRHFTKDSDGDRVEVPAQLIVYGGNKQYILGGSKGGIKNNENEIEWLAEEISQWLNIPLTQLIRG